MAYLPLVLMGPILRRVDVRWVCAFVARRRAADVPVTAFGARAPTNDHGAAASPAVNVGSQWRRTRPLGATLHAITVDVSLTGLPPRTRQSCDVVIDPGGESQGLLALSLLHDGAPANAEPKSLRLGCANKMLSSFVTPAPEIEAIRLAHTSCRKSHGRGPNGLAGLGTRIGAGLCDFTKATHQPFHTGDQRSRGGQQ
jgi:hypothetical protein